jgi:fatty-acid peroxygenase
VLTAFRWRDHSFKKSDWVLMDLYGTNHDARIWGDPNIFRPERFRERSISPYDLVSHVREIAASRIAAPESGSRWSR